MKEWLKWWWPMLIYIVCVLPFIYALINRATEGQPWYLPAFGIAILVVGAVREARRHHRAHKARQ